MVATPLKDHPQHLVEIPGTEKSVLQIGVIYGAKRLGQIQSCQGYALCPANDSRADYSQDACPEPLPLRKEGKARFFRISPLSSGQVFVYGFATTQEAVVEEWLDATSESGREINIFTRSMQDIKVGRLAARARWGRASRALRALKDLGVRNDQLLLHKIVELPDERRGELLSRVVWWLTECLTIVPAESQYVPLMDMIDANEDFRRFCGAFLKNVGTGIDGLSIERRGSTRTRFPSPCSNACSRQRGSNAGLLIGGPGVTLEMDADDPTKSFANTLKLSIR